MTGVPRLWHWVPTSKVELRGLWGLGRLLNRWNTVGQAVRTVPILFGPLIGVNNSVSFLHVFTAHNVLITSAHISYIRKLGELRGSLTDKCSKHCESPLYVFHLSEEGRRLLPSAALALPPVVAEHVFDCQPEAIQQEEGARNGMASKVGHLLPKPVTTSHQPPETLGWKKNPWLI